MLNCLSNNLNYKLNSSSSSPAIGNGCKGGWPDVALGYLVQNSLQISTYDAYPYNSAVVSLKIPFNIYITVT